MNEKLKVLLSRDLHAGKHTVLHEGTYESCIAFMRRQRRMAMDLMYADSGRLASYVL